MKAPDWLERLRDRRSRSLQVSIVLLTAWVPLLLYWQHHAFAAAATLMLGSAVFFYFNPARLGWRAETDQAKKRKGIFSR